MQTPTNAHTAVLIACPPGALRTALVALLEALLTNLKRYGYMACPCRLAKNDRQADRDIICPCAYRSADIDEFGSCYCGLYVSSAWNKGEIPERYVPERRPAEKC